MQPVLLIHYGELALKGGNRSYFETRLVRNIRKALRPVARVDVRRLYGRLIALPPAGADLDALGDRLRHVFGIAWFGRAMMTDMSWEALLEATDRLLAPHDDVTLGVRTKKADGRWRRGRTETNRDLGAHIVRSRGFKVDLGDPDLWVKVEIANGRVLVGCEQRPGPKGLPVGVSGRVLALLSGGIDSPVACWHMMSRGCELAAIHFHSAPYTSRASQDKVVELLEALTPYQPSIDLHMVPFAALQRQIVQQAPQEYRIVLYRRFMLRLAEAVGARIRAKALVTGESLGQVASQTVENMHAVEAAGSMTMLRPLIGLDKETIIGTARRIGTYELSIQPHDDCCSFLMPRRPVTRSTPEELDEVESALDVADLVAETLDEIEKIEVVG